MNRYSSRAWSRICQGFSVAVKKNARQRIAGAARVEGALRTLVSELLSKLISDVIRRMFVRQTNINCSFELADDCAAMQHGTSKISLGLYHQWWAKQWASIIGISRKLDRTEVKKWQPTCPGPRPCDTLALWFMQIDVNWSFHLCLGGVLTYKPKIWWAIKALAELQA